MFQPRPKQAEVLEYNGGMMGVSAVPGSGKTQTLSYLAARLIAEAPLADDQEILVVTLVNAAAGNFAQRVDGFIKARGLLPGFGYRVRTLHGLANDIVRERPALVGLEDGFGIVDERESGEILNAAVESWTTANLYLLDDYVDDEHAGKPSIYNRYLPEAVKSIAANFIKQAKDYQQTPVDLQRKLKGNEGDLILASMCVDIYDQYERGLRYRGAVDFQDLIRLALKALTLDEAFLKRLQHRWRYILEDEAQDSSQLQEQILRLLAGESGNWVRVGDPNQAIYETFTTANPKYLREFLEEPGVIKRELPNSGRSQMRIIQLANYLIDWTMNEHPTKAVRQKQPLQPPYIEPTPPGDPQPNPPDDPSKVYLYSEKLTPEAEINAVTKSVTEWLKENPDKTVAILVPRNKRGFDMVNRLKAEKIDYVELLRSTTSTREVAGSLRHLLNFLAHPTEVKFLATAYRVFMRDARDDAEAMLVVEEVVRRFTRLQKVEDFLHPQSVDALETLSDVESEPQVASSLADFRAVMRRWGGAVDLPIDQLVLTIAGDLFRHPADLAISYAMALYLRRYADSEPQARLPEYTQELERVAKNERKFLGLSTEDINFDPDNYRGKVTVATMHSAKGLEWDRVYLLSLNNYDFPSASSGDDFIGEKWFARDRLNLEAEALAQLESLVTGAEYVEKAATYDARVEYASERLRLLYVGITRARRELIITWNSGRGKALKAAPFIALQTYWEKQKV